MLLTTCSRASLMAASILALGLPSTAALAETDSESEKSEISKPSEDEIVVTPLSGQIEPDWGNIRTFWSNIRTFEDGSEGEPVNPFWGNIRTFWGDISPFEGDLNAFWGNIRTFNEEDPNSVTPEWGNIRTFWGEIGEKWGNIRTFWGNIRTFEDSQELADQLADVIAQSESFWGDAVAAETGQDFHTGFANPLLAKYGIDLNDPNSLNQLDAAAQEQFFIEWYDGLMAFSGADHVDYWMNQVRWNPAITQNLGEGSDTTIGLLDFTVNDQEITKLSMDDGISTVDNGHGSAVASLLVAPHDGKGVMGFAPMANVVAYNPFDETETAGWDDVRTGIRTLADHGASVINMSLGVSGWTLHPEWRELLSNETIRDVAQNAIFVKAAGNDGISQTTDIDWDFSKWFSIDVNPKLIIVGSVDPNNEISSFSNRPGTACLLKDGDCKRGNRLMDRFIVAPGEYIAVSDGNGGVTRRSGTSFAAPMVAGTIALIHDRWPWLADHPETVVNIILNSAQDLGEKGTDEVYGRGLLDVTAALSPASFDWLTWYKVENGESQRTTSSTVLKDGLDTAKWEAKDIYYYVFETVGFEGFFKPIRRDYAIPLSTKLIDQSLKTSGGSDEQFQAYLYDQLIDWMESKSSPETETSSDDDDGDDFTDVRTGFANSAMPVPNALGLNLGMSVKRRSIAGQSRRGFVPFESALHLENGDRTFQFTVGEGDGASGLGMARGFTNASDFNPYTGGANPLLGFASGGAYSRISYQLNDRVTLSAGVTEKTVDFVEDLASNPERIQLGGVLKPYKAGAQSLSVAYRMTDRVELVGSFTRLKEKDALLGVQSLDSDDFDGGSVSNGLSLTANIEAGEGIQLSATSTVSRSISDQASLRTSASGILSSAFRLGVEKDRVFDKKDRIKFSVAQPMHVEKGRLELDIVKVVDRQTGEIGVVTESFSLTPKKRPVVAEFGYGRSILHDSATVSLFGRAQLRGETASPDAASLLAGASLNIRY